MSLAEASEARKSRLLALRKRKAGETETEEWVFGLTFHDAVFLTEKSHP
jgi:hypothetical protein